MSRTSGGRSRFRRQPVRGWLGRCGAVQVDFPGTLSIGALRKAARAVRLAGQSAEEFPAPEAVETILSTEVPRWADTWLDTLEKADEVGVGGCGEKGAFVDGFWVLRPRRCDLLRLGPRPMGEGGTGQRSGGASWESAGG